MKAAICAFVLLGGVFVCSPGAMAQADFQQGLFVIGEGPLQSPEFYYATATGDVYKKDSPSSGWLDPPIYVGNFFNGMTPASDFLEGVRIVALESPNYIQIYYASPSGGVYRRHGWGPWDGPPGFYGNFFGGQTVPSDFQQGFRVVEDDVTAAYFYLDSNGGTWRQPQYPGWDSPAQYVGNFWGDQPVPTRPNTIGGMKAKYR